MLIPPIWRPCLLVAFWFGTEYYAIFPSKNWQLSNRLYIQLACSYVNAFIAGHSTIAYSVHVTTRKISDSNSKTFKNQQTNGHITDKVRTHNNDDCTAEQRRGEADGSYDNAAFRRSFSKSSKRILRNLKDSNKDFDFDVSDDETHVYDTRLWCAAWRGG